MNPKLMETAPAAEFECKKGGGYFGESCCSYYCIYKSTDGGKDCSSNADCEGQCLPSLGAEVPIGQTQFQTDKLNKKGYRCSRWRDNIGLRDAYGYWDREVPLYDPC